MILHIVRKDWRLLRAMVIAVALLNVLRVIVSATNRLEVRSVALPLANTLWLGCLLAMSILAVVVVQNDSIPGLRQDWLVRPIRRRDLLLSKILFVVLLVQMPDFLADLCGGVAEGLPFAAVMSAACRRHLWLLLVILLPMVALAALTRNLMETIGASVAVGVCIVLFMAFIPGGGITSNTGVSWITGSVQSIVCVGAAAAILGIQYYRRKTAPSRWLCGAAVIAASLVELMPWQPAFALQERLSTQPAAARAVRIEFDPSRQSLVAGGSTVGTALRMPVKVSGLGPDEILIDDRVDVRLTGEDGKTIDAGPWQSNFRTLEAVPGYPEYQRIWLPRAFVGRAHQKLELDYSLTLLKLTKTQTLSADSTRIVAGMGKCRARPNFVGLAFDLNCRYAGEPPCINWSLDGIASSYGHMSPTQCFPDYSPWFRMGRLGVLNSSNTSFPFHGTEAGFAEEWTKARLVARVYTPLAHFQQHLSIPDVPLDNVIGPR